MTDSDRPNDKGSEAAARVPRLKDALREARIELAERTAVVVDLRDAEIARLALLNDALEPIFKDISPDIELFDRGVVPGDPPRLWIDMIAHVVMGRDKRVYRFLQDTRYGRRVLAESGDISEVASAVTRYVARRLVERERALEGDSSLIAQDALTFAARLRRRRLRAVAAFVAGMLVGSAGAAALIWFVLRRLH